MSDNKDEQGNPSPLSVIPAATPTADSCARSFPSFPPNPAFKILPHPAKTNEPSDLTRDDPEQHGGLRATNPNAMAGPGPYIPSEEIAQGLEKPKTREEVRVDPLFSFSFSFSRGITLGFVVVFCRSRLFVLA
jgi:hypothetical protein